MNLLKKQKGLTLIEVMLSLVLVMIVLTTFLTVFINVNRQTSKIEDRFTALQLAEKSLIEASCQEKTVEINERTYHVKVTPVWIKEKALLKVTVSLANGENEQLEELYGVVKRSGGESGCD